MPHQPVLIKPVTKPVRIVYTNEPFHLPPETQKAIDLHWENLLNTGKRFTRGDVFTIQAIDDQRDRTEIRVALTDYAHYLSTIHEVPAVRDYPCRVVHTSVLIKTSDDFLAFGEMAEHTSSPKRLQCAGGGITRADILEDSGIIDVEHNAKTELLEETGLDWKNPDNKCSVYLSHIKTGGTYNFVGAMFTAKTALSAAEVQAAFDDHNNGLLGDGEKPEFSRLVFVKKCPKSVEAFFHAEKKPIEDYLVPWLELETGI